MAKWMMSTKLFTKARSSSRYSSAVQDQVLEHANVPRTNPSQKWTKEDRERRAYK